MANIAFTHVMVVCRQCGTWVSLDGEITLDQYTRWKEGELIQSAFPHLSADDRELLQTEICPTCWETIVDDAVSAVEVGP